MSEENVKFVLEGYARFNAGERRPEADYCFACQGATGSVAGFLSLTRRVL